MLSYQIRNGVKKLLRTDKTLKYSIDILLSSGEICLKKKKQ